MSPLIVIIIIALLVLFMSASIRTTMTLAKIGQTVVTFALIVVAIVLFSIFSPSSSSHRPTAAPATEYVTDVVVTRNKAFYYGARNMEVHIGDNIITVGSGETVRSAIPAGTYSAYIQIDGRKSAEIPVTLETNKVCHLQVAMDSLVTGMRSYLAGRTEFKLQKVVE